MKRLEAERRRLGLSQAGLSRRTESMNQTTICAAERGRLILSPGQAAQLCRALGLPEDQAPHLLDEVTIGAPVLAGVG